MKIHINFLKYLYDKLNLKYTYDEQRYNELINEYHIKKQSISKPANRIIFMCDGRLYHGGLTDRLKGILSTYYLAKKFKKPFYINWISPFQLEKYLMPNCYDWRVSSEDINYDKRSSYPLVFSEYPPKYYKKRNILSYLIFMKWLHEKNRDKHVYTNFYFPKKKFPILYNELFKLSPLLSSLIDKHLMKLGNHYWSFSFRFHCLLGDFNDIIDSSPLDPKDAEELINKNINEFVSLAKMLPEGYKCFITSDSQTFLKRIKLIDPRIYIVQGHISHIDLDKGTENDWSKLFIDQNLIMRSEKVFLLKTDNMYKSGFAKFAALIGGKEFIYHCF